MAVREVDCNGPGLRRRRAGKGFTYLEEDGTRLADVDLDDLDAGIPEEVEQAVLDLIDRARRTNRRERRTPGR